MGGVLPETVSRRERDPSLQGRTCGGSLGVHPPCRRGSDGTIFLNQLLFTLCEFLQALTFGHLPCGQFVFLVFIRIAAASEIYE